MTGASSTRLLRYICQLAEASPMDRLSDRELVERFASVRDEEAFAAVVRRHGAMVLGVCQRVLGHEHDAEDVFQATFLVLSRKAGALQRKEAVGPWLFGVAHRLALRARQQGRNRHVREARVTERHTGDPVTELTVREAHQVLDDELARLPERERGPLVLCYLQGLTRDEAAQRLGCPLGTLKSRLERARALLHKRLTRRGLTVNAVLATFLLTSKSALAIPALLQAATVKAAVDYAGGSLAGGVVGFKVAALADELLMSSLMGKIKVVAACLLVMTACIGLSLSISDSGSQTTVEDTAIAQRDDKQPKVTNAAGDMERAVPGGPTSRVESEPAAATPQRISPRFLDLQPHANQKLNERFGREGNDLAGLPRGEQVLAGIMFNIGDGLIQLRGRGTPHPEKVAGIKVGTTFATLHILHATQWDAEKDPIAGHYTLNYENLSQATIPIVFGKNTSNWWYTEGCSKVPSGAALAWQGTNEDARKISNSTIRLYMTSWKNPAPARRVASIDFTSTNSMAAPFCVAMTVE